MEPQHVLGLGRGPGRLFLGLLSQQKPEKTISQHGIPIPPSGPFTSQMQFFAAISGCAVAPLIHKDVGHPSENANSQRSKAPGTETRCLAALIGGKTGKTPGLEKAAKTGNAP